MINITSAVYTEDGYTIQAVIEGVECSVPCDGGNKDYRAILEWVAEGNTIQPYVEPEKTYQELRLKEYGTPTEQLERIIENGLDAEIARVAEIKARYPK